ncbi:MAG: ABC transporter permease [Microthrixaceae bacterium]
MADKEFRQVRRDRRTLVMMFALPLLLLVVFGYAASFNITSIDVEVVGPQATALERPLQQLGRDGDVSVRVTEVDPGGTRETAEDDLRNGSNVVAVVTGGDTPTALVDGSQLFAAQAAVAGLARAPVDLDVEVLFNPDLDTSAYMVPAIIGLILVFVGTMITSLGIVKEREAGTLEQLAVMPFSASDIVVGKLLPYFVIGLLDLAVVTVVGVFLFDVPLNGPIWQLALGGVVFLMTTMGFGVLISTVSVTQGQAIQLALMVTLPQVLLSGMVFPLGSMAAGVRWIAYLLPLTYFVEISRDVMMRGTDFSAMWRPYVALAVLGGAVFSLALVRFRRDLGPGGRAGRGEDRAGGAGA